MPTRVTTGYGDKGTSYLNPRRTQEPKSSPVFELMGRLDLLTSQFGEVRAMDGVPEAMLDEMRCIQASLMGICACMAGEDAQAGQCLPPEWLEEKGAHWNAATPELHAFVLLGGGHPASARLFTIRAQARLCERVYHQALEPEYQIPAQSLFLNRLSDYCFIAARYLSPAEEAVPDLGGEITGTRRHENGTPRS